MTCAVAFAGLSLDLLSSAISADEKKPEKRLVAASVPQQRCEITIKATDHDGRKDTEIYFLPVKSKIGCEKAAKFHRRNFDPEVVKNKEASYRWVRD